MTLSLGVLVTVLVIVAVFWGIFWLLGQMSIPEPMNLILRVIFGVIGIAMLLGALTGHGPHLSLG